jgi:hypothetical protein
MARKAPNRDPARNAAELNNMVSSLFFAPVTNRKSEVATLALSCRATS